MQQPESNSVLDLLFDSYLGAFLVAFAFVLVLPVTVPPTDGAYMEWGLLANPLVLMIMCMGAAAGGTIAFVLALFLLRRVDLNRTSRLVYTVVIATIGTVGPLFGKISVPTAFVALVLSMLYCKRHYSLAESPTAITE